MPNSATGEDGISGSSPGSQSACCRGVFVTFSRSRRCWGATLLSTYTLLIPSIIATPQSTLTQTRPLHSLVQTVYTLLCFSSPPRYAHPKKGAKKTTTAASIKAKLFALVGANLLPTVFSLVVSLTLGTVVFYGVLVLFGAAVTTSFAATVGAATHIALLVIFLLVLGSAGLLTRTGRE